MDEKIVNDMQHQMRLLAEDQSRPDLRTFTEAYYIEHHRAVSLRLRRWQDANTRLERIFYFRVLVDCWFSPGISPELDTICILTGLGEIQIQGRDLELLWEGLANETAIFAQEQRDKNLIPSVGTPYITSIDWPDKRVI